MTDGKKEIYFYADPVTGRYSNREIDAELYRRIKEAFRYLAGKETSYRGWDLKDYFFMGENAALLLEERAASKRRQEQWERENAKESETRDWYRVDGTSEEGRDMLRSLGVDLCSR